MHLVSVQLDFDNHGYANLLYDSYNYYNYLPFNMTSKYFSKCG